MGIVSAPAALALALVSTGMPRLPRGSVAPPGAPAPAHPAPAVRAPAIFSRLAEGMREESAGFFFLLRRAPAMAHHLPIEIRRWGLWGGLREAFMPEIGDAELHGLSFPVAPRFFRIGPGIYGGSRLFAGRPTDNLLGRLETVDELRQGGFRAIVNLNREDRQDGDRGHGLAVLHLDVLDNHVPTEAQAVRFLNFATDPEHRPLYIHCEAGAGRTSVFADVYLIGVRGLSADEALRLRRPVTPSQVAWVRRFARDLRAGRLHGLEPRVTSAYLLSATTSRSEATSPRTRGAP